MRIYVTAYWGVDGIRHEWISEASSRVEHMRAFHRMFKDRDEVRMWISTKKTTYKGWSPCDNAI